MRAERTDVLMKGNKIAAIGANITASERAAAEVLDCTGKLVAPGVVDTHHHLWQTQLEGRHADELLMQYMVSEFFARGSVHGRGYCLGAVGWVCGGCVGGYYDGAGSCAYQCE